MVTPEAKQSPQPEKKLSLRVYNPISQDNSTPVPSIFPIGRHSKSTVQRIFDKTVDSVVASTAIVASESCLNSSYTDLTTPGPMVTINVPDTGAVMVYLGGDVTNAVAESRSHIGVAAVSGANVLAAPLGRDNFFRSGTTNTDAHFACFPITGLRPGRTTFSLKYKGQASFSAATFANRILTIMPINFL